MLWTVRWLGGATFGLCLAALVPFLVEKGAEPRGHAVLWLLYGALVVSAGTWCLATIVSHLQSRAIPLEVHCFLDSSNEFTVALRPERPQFVLLCVAIRNPNPFNIEGVAVNAILPQSFRATRCGSRGEGLEEGHWLTTLETLPDDPEPNVFKDCWAENDLTIAGNGSKLLFFRIWLAKTGVSQVGIMLFGNAPKQTAVARLEVFESTTMTVGGTIGELLFEGVALTESPLGHHPNQTSVWMDKLADVVRSLTEEDRSWWDQAIAGAPVRSADPQQARIAVAARVAPLYDLRRRLERPGDSLVRAFRGGLFKHA